MGTGHSSQLANHLEMVGLPLVHMVVGLPLVHMVVGLPLVHMVVGLPLAHMVGELSLVGNLGGPPTQGGSLIAIKSI